MGRHGRDCSRGGHHRAEANLALECMVTLCLAGPEAERKFCCSINDGSHRVAYEMAREYLARRVSNPLQAVAKTRPLQ